MCENPPTYGDAFIITVYVTTSLGSTVDYSCQEGYTFQDAAPSHAITCTKKDDIPGKVSGVWTELNYSCSCKLIQT